MTERNRHIAEVVVAVAQPMVHVTRSASMDPAEIMGVMGEAYATLGRFLAQNSVTPVGAPLAVYRDWNGATMEIDVAFPVSPADAAKAGGDVLAGETPAGRALKAAHRGAYARLRDTYEAMEAELADAGLKAEGTAWEVYLNDPAQTPEDDLVTEVYMLLS